MEYSDTYSEILEEGVAKGRLAEAKRFVLRLGVTRFGPPDSATLAALEAISDLKRLEQLGERVLDVSSWQELIPTPRTQRRPRPPNRKL